jgi:uncharacterized protein
MAQGAPAEPSAAPVDPGASLAAIAAALKDKRLPPVDKWNPPYCGPMDLRIARDGTWFYMGTPIGRKELVKLFSTVLRRDPDGAYYLVTPVEKLGITVDDAPFVAVEAMYEGQGRERTIGFRLNTDDYVIAGPDHPVRVEIDSVTQEPKPYVHVRKGLEALINRPVFYDLVEQGFAECGGVGEVGLWSNGSYFRIGDLPA